MAIAAALVVLAGAPPSRADTFADPGFATEVVATVPPYTLVGLAFAPDGRLFVWQKNGVVRIIKNGALLPTPFVNLSSHVNTFDDRGMWGLAFDPNFSSNGYVYVTYTYENAGNPNDQGPKTARLTRITASPSNPDVALPGETVIMGSVGTPPCSAQPIGADCIPSDGGSHTLGEVHFASDGTLLAGVGDGADGGPSDPLPRRAQQLDSIAGKILRINKDGTAPTDNPFYDGTNSVRSKVWIYGVRNPFRFTVDEVTGELWFGDVGWNTWEEIDHGSRGANFGWPCFEGNAPNITYQSAPECLALPQGSVTFPFVTWNHSTGGTAAIGGPIYTTTGYPQQYQGSYFYGDYTGNFIRRVVFDAQRNPVSSVSFATGVPSPVSFEVGPDGLIYYLSFTTGEIRRIRFNGPAAVASGTPLYGYSPLTVTFSSAGSSNPGGGALTYLWDFGDGTTSAAANPTHTYTNTGVVTRIARLTVTGTGGLTSSATVPIVVGSAPPVPTITQPSGGTPVLPGQTVTFQGSATDPDDGPLAPSALKWTVLLHHNTHVHTFVAGSGTSGSFAAEDHGTIGTFSYEIILEATDSSGLKATTSVNVPVGSDTTPPSVPLNVVGTAVSSSQVNLAWSASTDDVAVTGYRVERCQGAGCSSFVQVGTPSGTSFSDMGLSASTSYSYRVAAVDAAGNVSGYSGVASVTTPAASDTTPPSAPTNLVGTATSSSHVDLSWTASTDNVGVTGYRVERCQSQNCSNFVQIATPAGTTFGSSGLAANTFYRYRVRAADAAGNLGAYSSIVTVRTLAADTSSPSAPTNLAATVVSSSRVDLSWTASTDNVGVTGYRVERCQGSGCTTFAQVGTPTGITFNDTGLAAGTLYRYRVRATDAAGNLSAYSSIVNATTQSVADTSPPSAPANLVGMAVSSSRIDLSWTASTDNVGVSGYRVERCQGAGCTGFAQVGSPTGTGFNDTGLSPSTSYSYRVAAVDGAGNVSGNSNVASATTPAGSVLPAGLVAGYSFDAGSGSALVDVSGNGNTGSLTGGVSWSPQGRFGSALSFNGTSGLVQVPASASLGLSGAMTLSGWINPAASQSGWRTIVQRQVDAYFLNASNDTGALRPSGGGMLGGTVRWVGGPSASPVGSWTHVALTYDGSMLRLFVNGVQVGTLAASGAIQSSSSPLWIGGNLPYGEYFNGLIDDVRVYNRALTQGEIQTDMNTPLGG